MRILVLLIYMLLAPTFCFSECEKAITFGGGCRLGDNLLDYAHAKWLSYKWGIPLFFHTFKYSDQFVFDDIEEKLTPEIESLYKKKNLKAISELDETITNDTLYYLDHACDSYDEYIFLGSWGTFVPVDWSDETFKEMMRTLIAPKQPLELITPPSGIVTVALHYRNGGGFVRDNQSTKRELPLRFPPDSYYIKQLAKLYALVNRQPMYVHIFTDHPNPQQIESIFKRALPYSNVKFDYRKQGNRHDANVLEDLFSMMNFDCLIRPMSHFSMTASHLGNFKIEFFPADGHRAKGKFIVDKVRIIQKGSWDSKKKEWCLK